MWGEGILCRQPPLKHVGKPLMSLRLYYMNIFSHLKKLQKLGKLGTMQLECQLQGQLNPATTTWKFRKMNNTINSRGITFFTNNDMTSCDWCIIKMVIEVDPHKSDITLITTYIISKVFKENCEKCCFPNITQIIQRCKCE